MPRYKLTLEYNGTGLNGWQIQDDAPTVQGHLREAFYRYCGIPAQVVGAGRTDAGVHALAQVAHVDLPDGHDPFTIMQAVNFHLLPAPIVVLKVEQVSEDFHARFSATARAYRYRIINRRGRLGLDYTRAWHIPVELDVPAMHDAAQLLVGTHDFSSFRDSECQAKSPLKTLEQLDVHREGEEIIILTSARSFLHHQVRIMTGSLKMVGEGKWTKADLQNALDARERKIAGPTAPADGLYLTGVSY